MMGRAEQVRSFPTGTVVKFSPKELHEICLFLRFTTDEVVQSAAKYAQQLGVPPT